jgi:hypothetical protein
VIEGHGFHVSLGRRPPIGLCAPRINRDPTPADVGVPDRLWGGPWVE